MDDQSLNRALVFGSQILALILVLTGTVLRENQLRSARPPGMGGQVASQGTETGRFARRWDDPFETTESFAPIGHEPKESEVEAPPSGQSRQASLRQVLQQPTLSQSPQLTLGQWRAPTLSQARAYGEKQSLSPEKVVEGESCLVLWNIIDSSATPEMREWRLRARYAIATALTTSGYKPEVDSYLHTAQNPASTMDMTSWRETFLLRRPRDGLPSKVIVGWHPMIHDSRVRTREDILDYLTGQVPNDGESCRVVVLNHGASSNLEAFLRDSPAENSENFATKFVLATIPDAELEGIEQGFADPYRGIGSDQRLGELLTDEIRLRVPVMSRGDRPSGKIVVFTESDTTYGRSLCNILEREFSAAHPGEGDTAVDVEFEFYPYLRGLDGRREESARNETPQSSGSGNTASFARGASERSWGTSQYDYLRRSAATLRENKQGEAPILAVGVLGSDVYDKLLVLQAVRPELPDVPYFTTDLESVYCQRDNLPYTRNLIIASSAGLTCEKSQSNHRIAPMRNSYQVALVGQVTRLLQDWPGDNLPDSAGVWEVGEGRMIDLEHIDREDRHPASKWLGGFLLTAFSWPLTNFVLFFFGLFNALLILRAISTRDFPDPATGTAGSLSKSARDFLQVETIVFAGAGLCLFLLLLATLVPAPKIFGGVCLMAAILVPLAIWVWMRQPGLAPYRRHQPKLISAIALPIAAAALILLLSDNPETFSLEPFDLISGVSIWPSVLLRILAFVVGLVLLVYTCREFLQSAFGAIHQLHAVPEISRDTPPRSSGLQRFTDSFQAIADSLFGPLEKFMPFRSGAKPSPADLGLPEDDDPQAGSHARIMVEAFDRRTRANRVALLSILYMIGSAALFAIWPAPVPARGGMAFFAEKITLSAGVGLYVVHLFFCVDLHLTSFRVISDLTHRVSRQTTDRRAARRLRQRTLESGPTRARDGFSALDLTTMTRAVGILTKAVGFTLLYPLAILSLLILSRLPLFDAWTMTPSLAITFGLGGTILISVSLAMVSTSRSFRSAVEKEMERLIEEAEIEKSRRKHAEARTEEDRRRTASEFDTEQAKRERDWIRSYHEGSLAQWYNQPIFAAIIAGLAIFGSLGVAEPLIRLLGT